MKMGLAEIPLPAGVTKLFSSLRLRLHSQKPLAEPDPITAADPVADPPPVTQEQRLERVFSKINESDGPVIDPKDPLDQAVLYVRMAAREKK